MDLKCFFKLTLSWTVCSCKRLNRTLHASLFTCWPEVVKGDNNWIFFFSSANCFWLWHKKAEEWGQRHNDLDQNGSTWAKKIRSIIFHGQRLTRFSVRLKRLSRNPVIKKKQTSQLLQMANTTLTVLCVDRARPSVSVGMATTHRTQDKGRGAAARVGSNLQVTEGPPPITLTPIPNPNPSVSVYYE